MGLGPISERSSSCERASASITSATSVASAGATGARGQGNSRSVSAPRARQADVMSAYSTGAGGSSAAGRSDTSGAHSSASAPARIAHARRRALCTAGERSHASSASAHAATSRPSAFSRLPPITRMRAIRARRLDRRSDPRERICAPRISGGFAESPRCARTVGARSIAEIKPRCCVVAELSSPPSAGPSPAAAAHSSCPVLPFATRCSTTSSSRGARARASARSCSRPRAPAAKSQTTRRSCASSPRARAGRDAAGPSVAAAIVPRRSAASTASRLSSPLMPA